MAPEKKFIHEYANTCGKPDGIEQVLRKYLGVHLTHGFSTRAIPNERLFFSPEESAKYAQVYPGGNPFIKEARQKEVHRVATENDLQLLAVHTGEIRQFLDTVMENGRGLLFRPAEIFKRAAAYGVVVSAPANGDRWHQQIDLAVGVLDRIAIEDLVEIVGILLPLHDPGSDLKFEDTKKCVECGAFYQAKGPKAIYCSEKCRSRARKKAKGGNMSP